MPPTTPGTTPGTDPGTTPGTTPGTDPGTSPTGAGVAGGGGEGGSGSLASGAPNMIGDLLGAGRSVSFIINRDAGPVFIEATGATTIVNPKVAENNSPLPRDRVGFRYNYFSNAVSITGLSSQTIAAPDRSLSGFIRPTQTKDYDYHLYTFNFEKTFLDGRASAEVRLPIRTSLSSTNLYSVGTIQGRNRFTDAAGQVTYYTRTPPPGGSPFQVFPGVNNVALSDALAAAAGLTPLFAYNVNPTPENTLGATSTELDNMSLILKGLMYRSPSLALSGGLSVVLPTANSTTFTVVDYVGPSNFNNVDTQRVREFKVRRDTWGLSPFVAALYAREDLPYFVQGFVQCDVPVGADRVTYTETTPQMLNPIIPVARQPGDPRADVQAPPFTARGFARDQVLMHLDLGAGYWLIRDSRRPWITGLAPTAELHYTTTLSNAVLARLPSDPYPIGVPTGRTDTNTAGLAAPVVNDVFPAAPSVGNTRNRLDIVNLTLGGTVLIADQASVAAAVALPLTRGDNRTFDWEFQLQVNFYFGGRGSAPPAPNMLGQ
jgi:hypothetical protein